MSTVEIVQEPDEQARAIIRLVFDKFEELGSAYAVFHYLTVNDLQLGFRRQRGGRIGELEWRPASHNRILSILRHPIYAGAYAYGFHRAGKKNPVTGQCEGGQWFVPPEEMAVLIQGRLPAYISWDQYLANQERLRQNRSLHDAQGVPKAVRRCWPAWSSAANVAIASRLGTRRTSGPATTAVMTGTWGWRSVAVTSRPRRWTSWSRARCCTRWSLRRLELSLRAIEDVEREPPRLHEQWHLKLERVRHEAERAERQYHAVEPENRLVARTLEARWEEALKQQRQVEEDYHRFLAKLPASLSTADRERIRELSRSVAALWHAAGTSAQDRKQIIRCLVERVILVTDRASEQNDVTIVWQGGLTTQHQVARPVGCYEQLKDYRRLTEPRDRASPRGYIWRRLPSS